LIPQKGHGAYVDAGLFATLGVQPMLGRLISAEEDVKGGPPNVVLSYPFWRDFLDSDPHVLGKAIRLSDNSYTVIGVMRPDFTLPKELADVFREAQPKVVAVEASGVLDMEYTAVKMFAQLAKRQSQHGVQLWLIGMTPRVLAIVQRSPLGQLLGREGMHFNLEIAVARYLDDAALRDQT
jgi:anti-anti-sigma regulatory factor